MKKNLGKKLITGLTIGVIAFGSSAAVYAQSATNPSNKTNSNFTDFKKGANRGFGDLVTQGIIDSQTADKMKAFEDKKHEEMKAMTEEQRKAYFEANKDNMRKNHFSEMVTAGIITQAQADAIEKAMPKRQERDFSQLVTQGVIDSQTADKMKAFADKKHEEIKAMTEEQRKAYFEANKDNNGKHHIDEMVTSGVITQAQADAIEKAMPKRAERDFSQLVTQGVIDSQTADKMKAFADKKHEEIKAMTEEQRKAYFEANKDKIGKNHFSEMVTAGVITQAQADAIEKAMPNVFDGQRKGHGHGMKNNFNGNF